MNHQEATMREVKRSPVGCISKCLPKAYTTLPWGVLPTNQTHKKKQPNLS